MEPKALERKLAAILYADVAGYSRLTGEDEEGTHRLLTTYLDHISICIGQHRGKVAHYAGDAVLADFTTASDAVVCAAAIQRDLEQRNAELSEERKVEFRIGVNLGEVIVDRNEIYGDGVNVAARLERLAEPGGICISEPIRSAVGNKVPLDYEFIGEQAVKNISQPVRAYHARLRQGAELPTATNASVMLRPTWRRTLTVAGIVGAFAVVGILAWLVPWTAQEKPASVERMALPLPDKPSIAVLPFQNMSGDTEQEYFADGMTEDLITDLSKVSGLFVIARNSTFAYKGKSVNVKSIAEELGVRYVLEGSIRRSGDQVRINAQLIDAATGGHVWADRYDGSLSDVFGLQDRITSKIVSVLAVELTTGERGRVARKATTSADAYDAFLRGWSHYRRATPEDLLAAIPLFEEALHFDRDYGRAHAALAATYWQASRRSWYHQLGLATDVAAWAKAEQNLEKARALPTPLALQVESEMLYTNRRFDEAISVAKEAVALDPNDPSGYLALANALTIAGEPGKAIEFIDRAMRLDPHYPGSFLFGRGLALFGLERYDDAAVVLEEATRRSPADRLAYLLLIAAYGHLERPQEAGGAIAEVNDLHRRLGLPSVTVSIPAEPNTRWPYKERVDTARLQEGLRKAGLPEW